MEGRRDWPEQEKKIAENRSFISVENIANCCCSLTLGPLASDLTAGVM
jgi:hypothetical protein